MQDRGYYPGGGMLSPNREIFYLNIPKNASTYLTNLLKANDWIHWNILDNSHEIKTTIAFIRDPLDRWISGFATYAALHLFGPGYGSDHFVEDFNDLSKRIIFDQVIFDDHTDLQVNYINQIITHNPLYFRCNSNLISQLNSFLQINLNAKDNIDNNKTESNYDTWQVSDFIKKELEMNPDLKSKIIRAYKQDYDFITSIDFYNDPR